MVDGPQGLFRLLRKKLIYPGSIDGVLVTHTHNDHVSGLETLIIWNRHFRRRKTRIFTSREVMEDLRKKTFPAFSESFGPGFREVITRDFEEFIEFEELAPGRVNWIGDSLGVEFRYNWHPVPTLGLRIRCRWGSVSISGDTCYNPALLQQFKADGILEKSRYRQLAGDWLWEADAVYHEATHHQGTSHTWIGDLEALPLEIRRKIRLVHVPDDFEAGSIPVAREGERLMMDKGGIRIQDATM